MPMADLMKKTFADRNALVAYLRDQMLSGSNEAASPIRGGLTAITSSREQLDVVAYGATRNYLDGAVTRLSPYIRHGLLSLNALRNQALEQVGAACAEGFIRQLAWRDFWHQLYTASPELVWQDIEPYKTGFSASDYAADLPEDIALGRTGVAVIDQFIARLLETGYLHNHIRLYLAAYIVHWRRIQWQAGAKWFLYHLLDADPASNNFSWQWVASTFANKPYIFNLDNIRKFASGDLNLDCPSNAVMDDSYEALQSKLFPNLPVETMP